MMVIGEDKKGLGGIKYNSKARLESILLQFGVLSHSLSPVFGTKTSALYICRPHTQITVSPLATPE